MCIIRVVREAVGAVEIAVGSVCGTAAFPISVGWCGFFLLFDSRGRETSRRFFVGGERVGGSGGDWTAWLGVTDGDSGLWRSSPAFGGMT